MKSNLSRMKSWPNGIACCVTALGVSLAGCAVTSVTTARNQPLPTEPDVIEASRVPRADLYRKDRGEPISPDKPFIGVAISGGGSRASNLGWAALRRLHELGILQHADAISSVSGGSIAAALYALNVDRLSTDADWERYTELLSHDFLSDWELSLANPLNWLAMAATDRERTHLMERIFDEQIFRKATFQDLGELRSGRPQLFINTTASNNGALLPIEDSFFRNHLEARLDTYPIASAVMASGAFPGVFGNITLNVYQDVMVDDPVTHAEGRPIQTYTRLYDGGPADNLGIWTLLRRAKIIDQNSQDDGKPVRGCLLIMIDANIPSFRAATKAYTPDTDHSLIDLFVKSTAWESIDVLLATNRAKTLRSLGFHTVGSAFDPNKRFMSSLQTRFALHSPSLWTELNWTPVYDPISTFSLRGAADPWEAMRIDDRTSASRNADVDVDAERSPGISAGPSCMAWHLTIDRLLSIGDYVDHDGHPQLVHEYASSDVFDVGSGYAEEKRMPDAPGENLVQIGTAFDYRQMLYAYMGNLKTSYRLAGPEGCSKRSIHAAIEATTDQLIDQDTQSIGQVCLWFDRMGLSTNCSVPRSVHPTDVLVKSARDDMGIVAYGLVRSRKNPTETPILACAGRESISEIDLLNRVP